MNFNIYRRKDGRYEGRLNIGKKANGKIQYKYVYANSYEECTAKIQQFISFYYKGKPIASLAKIKFQDISYQWLSVAKNHTKESTWSIYAYVLKRYLNPAFGKRELYLINETVINEFINRLLTKGAAISRKPLSKVTVHNIIVILKMIFGFMEKQYAIVNPVKNIHLSKINTRKKFLSDKHWQIICAVLQKDESATATAISIAVYMGLRIGEICALQKHDIDFDNNILLVCKTVQRINYTAVGKKNETRRRRTEITDFTPLYTHTGHFNTALEKILSGIFT
ncbi:tyrosine-type recombinase/integrase [Megamonas sp.]